MFAPPSIVFAYQSLLELLTEWHSSLFQITATVHCVHALMSFFNSELLDWLVDAEHDLEGATFPVKSGVLLPLLAVLQVFRCVVGAPIVIQGSHFNYNAVISGLHQRLERDCNEKWSVRWLPYIYPCGEVLDTSAGEVTSAGSDVDVVQVKGLVLSIPVKFMAAPRNTFEEGRTTVNAVYYLSSAFPGLSEDVPVVEDAIVK